MVNGLDLIIILLMIVTIYTILELVLVRATGCYCELDLDRIVDDDDGSTVGVYKGKRGKIDVEVTKRYISGYIPQSVNVLVTRIGSVYTEGKHCVLIIRTIFEVAVLFVFISVKYLY